MMITISIAKMCIKHHRSITFYYSVLLYRFDNMNLNINPFYRICTNYSTYSLFECIVGSPV